MAGNRNGNVLVLLQPGYHGLVFCRLINGDLHTNVVGQTAFGRHDLNFRKQGTYLVSKVLCMLNVRYFNVISRTAPTTQLPLKAGE